MFGGFCIIKSLSPLSLESLATMMCAAIMYIYTVLDAG